MTNETKEQCQIAETLAKKNLRDVSKSKVFCVEGIVLIPNG